MENNVIGRVVATEKKPTTIDDFTFWTDPQLILNPFDIVKVQHVNGSFSYGVIEDIAHITDAASFLTNFISSDFGDVNSEENTLRVGMNYVMAKVVCNTENIYIPLQSNAKVMLATAEEINYALGLNDIRNPLVCGYLEMYEGTRGCEKVTLPVNLNSKFCAVPKLEPQYCDYIKLKQRIEHTNKRFGARKDLLLLDNNVLASKCYNQIIDEIKECGFGVGATYTPPNEYEITINNLRDSYNDRAYIRKAISIYKEIIDKLKDDIEKTELYMRLEQAHCLNYYSASKEEILALDEYVRPLYEKTHKPTKRKRIVDFNQGIDSRLITSSNMKKLAEVNIYPLRIAFDHWKLKDVYEQAIRTAVESGIKNLSNYLLYNFEDKPEELYYRLRLNVDLCDELGANIYSFPMKYHPINDKEFFMNRDFIGKHWNRKFIRAVQAVLNSTKGKIGRGTEFFEEAFGRDVDEFMKILWMPETFIIYRRIYDADLRARMAHRYTTVTKQDCDLTTEWWLKFSTLPPDKLVRVKEIIALNKFKEDDYECDDEEINTVLSYYKITRDDAEN